MVTVPQDFLRIFSTDLRQQYEQGRASQSQNENQTALINIYHEFTSSSGKSVSGENTLHQALQESLNNPSISEKCSRRDQEKGRRYQETIKSKGYCNFSQASIRPRTTRISSCRIISSARGEIIASSLRRMAITARPYRCRISDSFNDFPTR